MPRRATQISEDFYPAGTGAHALKRVEIIPILDTDQDLPPFLFRTFEAKLDPDNQKPSIRTYLDEVNVPF